MTTSAPKGKPHVAKKPPRRPAAGRSKPASPRAPDQDSGDWRLFVGIDQGHLALELRGPTGRPQKKSVGLHDVLAVRAFIGHRSLSAVVFSSSTDFPEEAGAPREYDARQLVRHALPLQLPDDGVVIAQSDLNRIRALAEEKGFLTELQALNISIFTLDLPGQAFGS